MSMKTNADDGTGNSEKDWEIFDILCQNMDKVRVMTHQIKFTNYSQPLPAHSSY